jgi:hypothetical protein
MIKLHGVPQLLTALRKVSPSNYITFVIKILE